MTMMAFALAHRNGEASRALSRGGRSRRETAPGLLPVTSLVAVAGLQ